MSNPGPGHDHHAGHSPKTFIRLPQTSFSLQTFEKPSHPVRKGLLIRGSRHLPVHAGGTGQSLMPWQPFW